MNRISRLVPSCAGDHESLQPMDIVWRRRRRRRRQSRLEWESESDVEQSDGGVDAAGAGQQCREPGESVLQSGEVNGDGYGVRGGQAEANVTAAEQQDQF